MICSDAVSIIAAQSVDEQSALRTGFLGHVHTPLQRHDLKVPAYFVLTTPKRTTSKENLCAFSEVQQALIIDSDRTAVQVGIYLPA